MKLYVGNLSKEVTDAQLNELGNAYGKVVSAAVATDRASGKPPGFGFLEFENAEIGNAAITGLNGRDVNGQQLMVAEARPQKRLAVAADSASTQTRTS